MLEWQEPVKSEVVQGGEGPYPPPQRLCLVCGRQQWRWNGDQYECASGDLAHEERARQMWIFVNVRSELE